MKKKAADPLRANTTLLYVIFYVLYGNYQMRYFLMAAPTLKSDRSG